MVTKSNTHNTSWLHEFPWIFMNFQLQMFPSAPPRETLRFSGDKINWFPRDQSLSVFKLLKYITYLWARLTFRVLCWCALCHNPFTHGTFWAFFTEEEDLIEEFTGRANTFSVLSRITLHNCNLWKTTFWAGQAFSTVILFVHICRRLFKQKWNKNSKNLRHARTSLARF